MRENEQRLPQRSAACLLAAVVLCGAASEARATILLFNEARSATGSMVVPLSPGASVPQDYGDRVAGSPQTVVGGQFTYGNGGEGFTPNVLVDYFAAGAPIGPGVSLWDQQYGDLSNVIFGNSNSSTLNVRLTADAGFDVLLYSLDVAGWPDTDYTINSMRVLDGTTPLFSQSNVLVEGDFSGPRHTSFDFANPLRGSELLIEIDYSNLAIGLRDNIGIDNIRFGQDPPPPAVPEPPPWLLLSLCLFTLPAIIRKAPLTRRPTPPALVK